MKLTFTRENLLAPLGIISSIASSKTGSSPILSNLLIAADEDRATITATDLERQISIPVSYDDCSDGWQPITVNALKLNSIIKTLPSGAAVSLTINGDAITVTSGRSRFKLNTLPGSDYPTLAVDDKDTTQISVETSILRHLLDRTRFAAAVNDVRYYLNGVLLEIHPDKLVAVATDGHRLAKCEQQATTGHADAANPRQFIIPNSGVDTLLKLMGGEQVQLHLSARTISATFDSGAAFVSKLVDGRYPDYYRVIPTDPKATVATIPRASTLEALQRVNVLADEKYKGVAMHFDDRSLTIESALQDEIASDQVDIELIGEPMKLGFNLNYIHSALKNCTDESVRILMTDPMASIRAEDANSPVVNVIMPMRL